jgi:hypothetical protein
MAAANPAKTPKTAAPIVAARAETSVTTIVVVLASPTKIADAAVHKFKSATQIAQAGTPNKPAEATKPAKETHREALLASISAKTIAVPKDKNAAMVDTPSKPVYAAAKAASSGQTPSTAKPTNTANPAEPPARHRLAPPTNAPPLKRHSAMSAPSKNAKMMQVVVASGKTPTIVHLPKHAPTENASTIAAAPHNAVSARPTVQTTTSFNARPTPTVAANS